MSIYKRGDVYWYEFHFNGERIRESPQTSNRRAAEKIEAAHRTRLAKGEAGTVDRPPAPTLTEFAPRFEKAIQTLYARKPATVVFYESKLGMLLQYQPIASCPLDQIDEVVSRRSNSIAAGNHPAKESQSPPPQ